MNLMTVCPDWGWRWLLVLNYDFEMFDIYLHWLRHWLILLNCIVPESKFHHKIWQTQSVFRIPIILKSHNRQSVVISSTTKNSHSPLEDKLYIIYNFRNGWTEINDGFAKYRTLFEFRMPLRKLIANSPHISVTRQSVRSSSGNNMENTWPFHFLCVLQFACVCLCFVCEFFVLFAHIVYEYMVQYCSTARLLNLIFPENVPSFMFHLID